MRLGEARATRADVLATACPNCADVFSAPGQDLFAVRGVLEILADAL